MRTRTGQNRGRRRVRGQDGRPTSTLWPVWNAAWWGFVGGFALILGALVGLYVRVSVRVIGLIMAFGAGVLISAVAFELTQEAYQTGGGTAAALGLVAGSLVFFTGDWAIDNAGGHRRKSPIATHDPLHPSNRDSSSMSPAPAAAGAGGMALVLGALRDGVPESAAIGISLLEGGGVGAAMIAAVFLSNMPESISATTGMRLSGRSPRYILGLWSAVCAASTLASVAGYALLGDAPDSTVAFIQTFAAGAIITMLADTMVPEAVEHAGKLVGLFTMFGFALAFFLGAT